MRARLLRYLWRTMFVLVVAVFAARVLLVPWSGSQSHVEAYLGHGIFSYNQSALVRFEVEWDAEQSWYADVVPDALITNGPWPCRSNRYLRVSYTLKPSIWDEDGRWVRNLEQTEVEFEPKRDRAPVLPGEIERLLRERLRMPAEDAPPT
jgi:hypothetical protein